MTINANKVGLTLGSFLGFLHLVWSVLVAAGVAQPLLDFIYRVHFLNNSMQVAPFGFKRAIALIVITSVVGYIAGSVFSLLWNRFQNASA